MTSEKQHEKARSRNETFAERTATRIWSEDPSEDNPYIAARASCHGYDLISLIQKRSFTDVFYLLFRGELPSANEAGLLERLMIALINPGPRHPATRAAMNAGIGKTDPVHILPIASAVLGGKYLGGGDVEDAMRFLRKRQDQDAAVCAAELLQQVEKSSPGNTATIPGFGSRYGGIDLLAQQIASELSLQPGAGKALHWGNSFANELSSSGTGWLMPGVAAAVFSDLGFHPRAGGALFQLLGAPGLVAHGLELANKPITAMPFVRDENYVIER